METKIYYLQSLPEFYFGEFGVYPNICLYALEGKMLNPLTFNRERFAELFESKDISVIKRNCDVHLKRQDKEFFRNEDGAVEPFLTKSEPLLDTYGNYHLYDGKSSMTITLKDMKMVVFVNPYNIQILHNDFELNEKDVIKKILKCFSVKKIKDDGSPKISVLAVTPNGDFYANRSDIKSTKLNIGEFYNDDFMPYCKKIEKFIVSTESGIVFLSGEPGTGKTNLLRHFITKFTDVEFFFCSKEVMRRLGSPSFSVFLQDHKSSIFILEDCEDAIRARDCQFNGIISDILNMSDGLMSDVYNIKFICTFNDDISKIDDALLRKGRCKVNYRFEKLCKEKVAKLIKKHKIKNMNAQDMTLAEIFNRDDNNTENLQRKKIGY